MVCIARRPRCGTAEGDIVPEPLTQVGAALGVIGSIITALIAVGKAVGAITVANGVISVAGTAIASGAGGGAIAGFVAGVAVIIIVGLYALDRCVQGKGLRECVAGVVTEVVESFSSGWDQVFPFAAMHDRVDVVAKSRFWDVIEDGDAFVFCTEELPPRRSEIMRCYFYDEKVCKAADAAIIGAGVGAAVGIIVAAAIAAALCVTLILCLIGLLLAALAAAIIALVGAFAGGQIGKAAAGEDTPTTGTGETIAAGQLVSIKGNMVRREYDENANVIYWTSSADFHGLSVSPQPFSYCEIDDEMTTEMGMDLESCERAPGPIL
jgi:hypothetical protein